MLCWKGGDLGMGVGVERREIAGDSQEWRARQSQVGAAAAVNRQGRAPKREGWLVGEHWAFGVGHDGKLEGEKRNTRRENEK